MIYDLETWLAMALADADPVRRSQLRAEILDHVAEAEARYRQRGDTPEAAHAAALADLGDPQETAQAVRHTWRPSWRARLRHLRRHSGQPFLAAILALGVMHTLSRPLILPSGSEVGSATAWALILQVAALTLALSIPLLFDDLDLSAGVVVLLGAYLIRVPDLFGSANISAVTFPAGLALVALVGAGIGVMHGVASIILRIPTAWITLAGGGLLAGGLLAQPAIHSLPLSSAERMSTLEMTVGLTALSAVMLCLAMVLLRRRGGSERGDLPRPAGSVTLQRTLHLTLLALPLVLALAYVRLSWGSTSSLLLLTAVGALTGAGIRWVVRASSAREQTARIESLGRRMPWVVVLAVMAGIATSAMRDVRMVAVVVGTIAFMLPLALVVACALAIIVQTLTASRGTRWLGFHGSVHHRAAARIGALMLSSGIAAALGACIAAQGIRDGTAVHAMAFYTIVPLIGLLIGGQHILPLHLRPLGACLGGLIVAGSVSLGSDNLDAPAFLLILAALIVPLWPLRSRREHFRSGADVEPEEPAITGYAQHLTRI